MDTPPLAELVKMPLSELEKWLPHLGLAEILIIGANPLSRKPRDKEQLPFFRESASEKLRELEKQRKLLLDGIISKFYSPVEFQTEITSNYFEKYQFLITAISHHPNLERLIEPDLLSELEQYKTVIKRVTAGNTKRRKNDNAPNHQNIEELKQISVNLLYLHHQDFAPKDSYMQPYIIGIKTKVPERISWKILYKMIGVEREHRAKNRGFRKDNLVLEGGIIRDIVGIQFVTYGDKKSSEQEINQLKQYITTSKKIETLGIDNYYRTRLGPYCAIHIDSLWNPSIEETGLFDLHGSVEIILIEFEYFVRANLGVGAYLNRIKAQTRGIVGKEIINGQLAVSPFTEPEMRFMEAMTPRILDVIPQISPVSYNHVPNWRKKPFNLSHQQ